MAMTLLEDWCRGMDVNSQSALLVWGIPVNCDEAEIEETLQAAMPQVHYRVLGRMFWREEGFHVPATRSYLFLHLPPWITLQCLDVI